jgi:hypothetical protein
MLDIYRSQYCENQDRSPAQVEGVATMMPLKFEEDGSYALRVG